MAGLSHEPESKGCIEEIISVEEIHASTHHGALDLFLKVVVDAEALTTTGMNLRSVAKTRSVAGTFFARHG